VQEIVLLAGNVARDQAAQFAPPPVAPPSPPSPASPPASAPTPRESRLSPCDAAGPTLFAAVDFAPFAGVSTVDRGRSIRNLSLGLVGELSGGVKGVAVSGALALDRGPLCGVQVAGIVDVARESKGAQIAGALSFARGITGAQIAGAANVTGPLTGVQIAGGANVAWDDAAGAQVGPVNVAAGPLRGVQVGVVNYARDADFQLGVVNIVASGRLRLDAWSKPETGIVLLGLKHGGRHYHWIYGVGTRVADPSRPWAVLGLGAHATPAASLYVDFDVIDNLQLDFPGGSTTHVYEARATVGYALLPQVSAFVGPTFNVLGAARSARSGAPDYSVHLTDTSDETFRAWPGVVLGLEGL
jgi:hypothetical protein